jgi:hypothetical protein
MTSSASTRSNRLHAATMHSSPGDAIRHRPGRDLVDAIATGLATGLIAIAMVVAVWNPCDSVAAIAAGDSLAWIGLTLLVGALTACGVGLQPMLASIPYGPAAGATQGGSAEDAVQSAWIRRMHRIGLWAWLLFPLWLGLATAASIGNSNARFAINGFWQWTSLWVLANAACFLARRPGWGARCLVLMLAIGMGVVSYGWVEYAWIQPALRASLAEDPVGTLERRGIAPDSAAAMLIKNRIESTEMRSVYALANSLAGALVVAWTLTLGWAFSVWQNKPPRQHAADSTSGIAAADRKRLLIAAIFMLVFMGAALLVTKSRTAWLASSLATLAVAVFHPTVRGELLGWLRAHPRLVGTVMTVVACVAGGTYWADPLIFQEAGKSLAYRLDYWRGAMALIAMRPWLGYGALNFQATYLQVKSPTAAESPADPHNLALEIAHAGGWPLLGISCVIGLWFGIRWWLSIRPRRAPRTVTMESQSDGGPLVGSPFAPGSGAGPDAVRWDGRWFWSGAWLAALGVFAWSFFTAGDAELIGTIIGLTVGVLTVVLLTRWEPGATSMSKWFRCDAYGFGIAMAGFVIHLLASGGWMLPGTMALPAVLLGVWLASSSGALAAIATSQPGAVLSWPRWRWGVAAAAWLALATWGWTMLRPVTAGLAGAERMANSLTTPSIEEVEALLTLDPYDPELARFGLEQCVQQLERPLGSTARADWEAALKTMRATFLDRDPKHALAYAECGRVDLRVAALSQSESQRRAGLEQAAEDFAQGAVHYPASAEAQLQAALAAFLAGRQKEAAALADRAEAISTATRHDDRKLNAAQVFWPRGLEIPEKPLDPVARRGTPKDFARAEPVLHALRSLLRP